MRRLNVEAKDFLFKGPTPVQNSLEDARLLQARIDRLERALEAMGVGKNGVLLRLLFEKIT